MHLTYDVDEKESSPMEIYKMSKVFERIKDPTLLVQELNVCIKEGGSNKYKDIN